MDTSRVKEGHSIPLKTLQESEGRERKGEREKGKERKRPKSSKVHWTVVHGGG